MSVKIETVTNPHKHKGFFELPWEIYKGDPNWVPPLRMAIKVQLNPDKGPFFKHGKAAFFVAIKNGEVVGRIAAIDNPYYTEKFNDGGGFFGWFEATDDLAVFKALLKAAGDWLKERGFTKVYGPESYSLNDENPGVLVEGFDKPPVMLLGHSPKYYKKNFDALGFKKSQDLLTFTVSEASIEDDRFDRLSNAVLKRNPKISLRSVRFDRKGFKEDVRDVMGVFNRAWEHNWGQVDVSPAEIEVIATDMKMVTKPAMTAIAQVEGTPVGVIIGAPDVNESLIRIPNGRLLPFGWWKVLTGMKKAVGSRTLILGVDPEYRNRGIEIVLIWHVIKGFRAAGCSESELAWILESNEGMVSMAQKTGAKLNKTYRIYEAELDDLLAL
ncbi:GNAT family N-acetyltransferase [Planctomycetota bacterium]|nr:GNAT family N-acetyltransferase [Planctomycetota bacterium]